MKTREIKSQTIGQHTIKLLDNQDSTFTVCVTVQPRSDSTVYHNQVRKMFWDHPTLQDAREEYESECHNISRNYVCLVAG